VSQGFLIGLDAGGGSGRCLVLDVGTGAVTTAVRPWTHPVAPGTSGLGRDLELETIWSLLADATRDAMASAGATAGQVLGIAATSMRFGLVVVGSGGSPLYAGPNSDARAAGEGLRLAADHGEQFLQRTGHWMNPVLGLPRLRFAAANLGNALPQSLAAFSLGDWVAWRLCGQVATDPTQAAGTALLDLRQRDWADDLIAEYALPRHLFPDLREPGTPLGVLGSGAAADLALRPGTPVAVGGADTQCGLLGGGAVAPSEVGIVAGTTTPVQMVLDAPTVDPEGRLWTEPYLLADRWVLESNAGPMGESLEWFAGMLYPNARAPVARLFGEASQSEIGARGQTSTLGGEVMNARELGLPVANFTLSRSGASGDPHASRDLARAAVESAAYTLRANLEQIVDVARRQASRVILGGGLSRSETLAQITAGVLARSVSVAQSPEASALGAALCAGTAAGVWSDLRGAAASVRARLRVVEPDPAECESYATCYASWQELRASQAESTAVARRQAIERSFATLSAEPEASRVPPRPRILVTAPLDNAGLAALRALGDVEYASYRDAMRLLSGDSLVEALRGFDVFVTEIDVVDAGAMLRAGDLRIVASCRGDAVNVDVEAASALGIPVLNAPGRNADAVADLTLAFLLMLARKLASANTFLREPGGEAGDMGRMGRAFRELQGRELWHKTVGLVGLGAVGRSVARRLEGFGVRVLAHDPFVTSEQAAQVNAEVVPLETLLRESDFVSLHAPVTDATRHLIGVEEFARMKPGACFVNTARAALVDESALVDALQGGHLAGAAVDVFSVEPPASDHPLLAMPQVLATPHVGGNTAEVAEHQGAIIANELSRLLGGELPQHVLNPDVARGFDLTLPRNELSAAARAELARRPAPAVTDLQMGKPRGAKSAVTAENRGEPSSTGPPAALVARMQAILSDFCVRVAADPALRDLAGDKDVTLLFTLSDLDLRFWIRLRDGVVRAEPGTPDGDPEVSLKLTAEIFDGMFTGASNPMQAAMEGRLSFSGDTAKAMALQELQRDLSRLYRAVREEQGGPGDLSALAPKSAFLADSGPGDARSSDLAPSGRPRVGDERDELCDIIDELFAQQVITATGGNVSVRVPDREELWITPSQLFKGDLRPQVLVRIDLAGRALDEDARAPSSERLIHCAVYRSRPQANAVIHAHAPHATILANAGLPFLPVSTEAAFFGDIPRVPFIMPGTQDLADAIGTAALDSWAVLMLNHGLLVGGRSLRRAADMVEIIERSSEIILGCLQVGKEPPVLPDDVVAKLRQMGDLIA